MKRSRCDGELLQLTNYGSCKRLRVSEATLQGLEFRGGGRGKLAARQSRKLTTVTTHKCGNNSGGCCPDSLTKLAAKVAAAHTPFQLVEVRYPRIPEPVVRQFIKWSFPRCEADIRRYSALSCAACEHKHGPLFAVSAGSQADSHRTTGVKESPEESPDDQEKAFNLGLMLAGTGAVQQAMQIGKFTQIFTAVEHTRLAVGIAKSIMHTLRIWWPQENTDGSCGYTLILFGCLHGTTLVVGTPA